MRFIQVIGVLYFLLSFGYSFSLKCPSHFFNCGHNDDCISSFFVCDGEMDCKNGADELDCHSESKHFNDYQCPAETFRCNGTSQCLPLKWRCDGHKDCKFGDDERFCTQSNSSCTGFKCTNTEQCLPKAYQCDGTLDCHDGSDEVNCPPKLKASKSTVRESKLCLPELGRFECASGQCLSFNQVCDGHSDCTSHDDEGLACSTNHQSCKTANCSHGCMATPHGIQCFCPSGYRMKANMKTCEDINECELGLHQCHQHCVNTVGAFKCTCDLGYKLTVDNFTCTADISEPLLLFSDGESVRGRWLRSNRLVEVVSGRSHAMGIDMHMQQRRVFWTEVHSERPAVYSIELGKSRPELLLSTGLSTPEDIAIDWVGQNFYVTDAGLRKILVCNLNALHCHTCFDSLDSPRAITLWPANATVYWTDWGERAGIFAGAMDGSKRWPVIARDIVWPNGIALDEPLKRLYWADAKLERIEFVDLLTGHREVIVDDAEFHPFSLDVFEGQMYWSDWLHFTLDASNKFNGRNLTTLVKDRSNVFGVRVMHPVRQTSITHECITSPCSHLCLLGVNQKAVCACPDHMHLGDDQQTCEDKDNHDSLLYATSNQIYRLHPNAIGKDKLPMLAHEHLPNPLFSVDDFTYDSARHRLFIFSKSLATVYRFDLNSHRWTSILRNMYDCQQLTYDPFSSNLIWLSSSNRTLQMVNTDGQHPKVLVKSIDSPTAFTLYPEEDQMFVAYREDHRSVVARFDTLGRFKTIILHDVGDVTSMYVCRHSNRIYWADSLRGEVRSVHLHNYTDVQVVVTGARRVQSIAVQNERVYWLDLDSSLLHFGQDHKENSWSSSIPLNELTESDSLRRLHLLPTYPIPDTCVKNEANCSYLCSFAGFRNSSFHSQMMLPSVRCVCPDGSSTDEANRHGKCERQSICPANFFHCPSDNQCIRASDVCDGHRHCSKGEDEAHCDVSGCLAFESRCQPNNSNSICISNSWFCDGDKDCPNGEDEIDCSSPKSTSAHLAHSNLTPMVNGTCPRNGFKCDGSSCLNWHRVCDQHVDCADGSDENESCLLKCACKNNGRCYLTNNSSWLCHCMPGFEGKHCEHHVTSSTVSSLITLVTKKPEFEFRETDPFEEDSGQAVTVIIITVLLILFVILGVFVYYLESEGRLSRIRRRLQNETHFSFRSPLSKTFSTADASANLIGNMEEADEEDFKSTPYKIDL